MLAFIIWVGFAVLVAVLADRKDRNWFGWLLLGLIFWPAALLAILLLKPSVEGRRRKLKAQGLKACPVCAEMIMREAKACPYCNRDLEEDWDIDVPSIKRIPDSRFPSSSKVYQYWFDNKQYETMEEANRARIEYIEKHKPSALPKEADDEKS